MSILVVGGGIGGLAAAIAIRRSGRDAIVFEREGDLRGVGAGLSLWPNAMGVLDRLGVGTAVRARASRASETIVSRPDGHVIAGFPPSKLRSLLGDDVYVVHRAELLASLQDAVDDECLRLRTPVTGVTAHDDGTASATTGDGVTLHGAGVVGADGTGSIMAQWMQPDVQPRYAGWTAWRGVASFPSGAVPGPPFAEVWGRDGRRFGTLPLPGDRAYWYATANRPEGERSPNAAAEHAALVRDLDGWGPVVRAVLAATDPASALRHDVYDRAPLASWVRGAVCLLGDAAHPMQPNLGQGACQALEDAEVLGACLAVERTVAAAFARYEAVRKRHVEHVVALSRRLGRIGQASGILARARDAGAGLVPSSLTGRSLAAFAAMTTGPRGL